jgi:hypothetical protein
MKQWPEKIEVFLSAAQKDRVREWCRRNRIPLTEAGRAAFDLLLRSGDALPEPGGQAGDGADRGSGVVAPVDQDHTRGA